MKTELKCDVLLARELEDAIRATRKYTKGAFSRVQQHPIQGDGFASKLLTEYYEVYPDLEIGWDMKATDAWAWVWGDTSRIEVAFRYDYRDNRARITVYGGRDALRELGAGIPGLKAVVDRIQNLYHEENSRKHVAPKAAPATTR